MFCAENLSFSFFPKTFCWASVFLIYSPSKKFFAAQEGSGIGRSGQKLWGGGYIKTGKIKGTTRKTEGGGRARKVKREI